MLKTQAEREWLNNDQIFTLYMLYGLMYDPTRHARIYAIQGHAFSMSMAP